MAAKLWWFEGLEDWFNRRGNQNNRKEELLKMTLRHLGHGRLVSQNSIHELKLLEMFNIEIFNVR